jgi:CheY-like chemotaxis protein
LLNLLSNAVKFTSQGSVELRITENRGDGESHLRFEVVDSGIGIPKSALGKLFQPFSQVDSSTSRRYGGTGLGLSISRRLAELMGGEMGVESVQGKGSTFWLKLALAHPTSARAVEMITTPSAQPSAANGFRVLIAEDNVINQKVARGLLLHLGYDVDVVSNGREVLELLGKSRYDAILMDCQMPEVDGYEATAEIRRRERAEAQRAIPIIALTASAIKGDRERCVAAGMDDYVSKPLKLEDIDAALKRWVRAGV